MNYNKKTDLILCIFLGVFGAHKFYEGKVKRGILYLLTFGLFGIGWLVDIFLIINKPSQNSREKTGNNLDFWVARKEKKHLYSILRDGETPICSTTGEMDGNIWLAVCTNQRVIFIDSGIIYGVRQNEIPLRNITSASYRKRILSGDILIYSYGVLSELKNVPRESAQNFIMEVNRQIDNYVLK